MSSEARYALYYFLLFGSIGAIAPFASLWLNSAGIEPAMIGIISAAPSVVMLLTTIRLGRWADGLQDRRYAIVTGNWVILIAQAILFIHTDLWTITLVWIVVGVAMYAIVPITDAAALSMSHRRGSDFARIRTFGSIGFVVALLSAGYVYEHRGISVLLWVWLLANALRLMYSYFLPANIRIVEVNAPQKGVIGKSGRTKDARESDELYQTPILLTLIGSALINASHAMVYTFGILHWTQTGLSEYQASIAIGAGVVVEILLMWWFKSLAQLVSSRACLVIAALCAIFRWGTLASEPSMLWIFLVQILHGVTFGVMYLASASFLSRRVPEHSAARAQTLLATITTAFMAIATYLSGLLYEQFAGKVYWLMALMCLLGFIVLLYSYRYPLNESRD